MNKLSWKDVSGRLKAVEARKDLPESAEFWSDFKARAALVRQEQPAPVRERLPVAVRWGTATALALFLVAVGWFVLPAAHSGAITQIKALEVVAPHSGVIIMNDQSGRGTILWITGMESKTVQQVTL
jgi:hypothetical protein